MYNGGRPWAARQAQLKLFRELGANGVIIPTDTIPDVPPVQLGGDQTSPPPAWWPVGATETEGQADGQTVAPGTRGAGGDGQVVGAVNGPAGGMERAAPEKTESPKDTVSR